MPLGDLVLFLSFSLSLSVFLFFCLFLSSLNKRTKTTTTTTTSPSPTTKQIKKEIVSVLSNGIRGEKRTVHALLLIGTKVVIYL